MVHDSPSRGCSHFFGMLAENGMTLALITSPQFMVHTIYCYFNIVHCMVDKDRFWLAKVNRRASDIAFKITNNISTIYVGILLNVYIVIGCKQNDLGT